MAFNFGNVPGSTPAMFGGGPLPPWLTTGAAGGNGGNANANGGNGTGGSLFGTGSANASSGNNPGGTGGLFGSSSANASGGNNPGGGGGGLFGGSASAGNGASDGGNNPGSAGSGGASIFGGGGFSFGAPSAPKPSLFDPPPPPTAGSSSASSSSTSRIPRSPYASPPILAPPLALPSAPRFAPGTTLKQARGAIAELASSSRAGSTAGVWGTESCARSTSAPRRRSIKAPLGWKGSGA